MEITDTGGPRALLLLFETTSVVSAAKQKDRVQQFGMVCAESYGCDACQPVCFGLHFGRIYDDDVTDVNHQR